MRHIFACSEEALRLGAWAAVLLSVVLLPFDHFFGQLLRIPKDVTLAVMTADLARRILRGNWWPSPFDRPLWIYTATMGLATVFSVDPTYSAHAMLQALIPTLVLYHTAWNHLQDGRSLRDVLYCVVLSAALTVGAGFVVGKLEGGRLEGVFPVSTRYGKYLDLILPLTAILLVSTRRRIEQTALGALTLAEIAALFLTGTRAAWIAVGSVLVVATLLFRRLWPALLLALVGMTFFLVTPEDSLLRQRAFTLLSAPVKLAAEDPALQDRRGYYETAWAFIQERPLHGWGYGAHIAQRASASKDPAWFAEHEVKPLRWHSHNLALEILLQGGLLALFSALWIVWILVRTGGSLLFAPPCPERLLGLGCLAGLSALGLHSVVSVPQWSNTLLTMLYIAALTAAERKASSPSHT